MQRTVVIATECHFLAYTVGYQKRYDLLDLVPLRVLTSTRESSPCLFGYGKNSTVGPHINLIVQIRFNIEPCCQYESCWYNQIVCFFRMGIRTRQLTWSFFLRTCNIGRIDFADVIPIPRWLYAR